MKYLIPLKKISIGTIQQLYENGYYLNFSYGSIPYVEVYERG